MAYPADYGFIEGTLGEDGDPVDALVLASDPTFPGCRIRVRTIGVFHMSDEKGPDEKLLCVPLGDPSFERVRDVHDVNAELRDEIEHFFQRYKDLQPSKAGTDTRGLGNRHEAEAIVAAAGARVGNWRQATRSAVSRASPAPPSSAPVTQPLGGRSATNRRRLDRPRRIRSA